jgi:hypothetical protein
VVDVLNRVFCRVEVRLNRHGEPRKIGGARGEKIVHGTFLGVNGGQYQKAAQGICRDFGKYLAA